MCSYVNDEEEAFFVCGLRIIVCLHLVAVSESFTVHF